MTTHLADPLFSDVPWCGHLDPDDEVVTRDEAHDPNGRHFDCVDCHRRLTGGVKHGAPDDRG